MEISLVKYRIIHGHAEIWNFSSSSTNSKMAYSLQLTNYQAIKLNFPQAKLAMRVLTRFVNCLQNLNIARMEHAARNSGFAKTSWEQKFVSVKKATRTNTLAVQVISNGNRTD